MESYGDENKERGNWTGKLDFLLSCIGYAVGLGNVWRFPYLAYDNGGASFLIPYVIFLLTAGLPLFFMELAFGQFASLGPISIWRAAPFFKGIGYGMVIISGLVCIYYNMIIAWTLFYLFASFTSELPWQRCGNWWNTLNCTNREMRNFTVVNITETWCKGMKQMNKTDSMDYITNCTITRKSPSQEYWERYVLDQSEGIDEGYADFRWQLVLCLLLAWIVIFICLSKGIKSSGKVVYVTAIFPYIVLIILVVRGCTLEGAIKGINFYIIPDWEKLKTAKPWGGAAVQIFYSLGVAFGGLQTMSSYNRFNNNCYRDALLVAFINCGTSVFAGFAIFSVIGFMSHNSGVPVDKVAAGGAGLAFVAYPEGISMMPVAPLWSILFFIMLFTLGLDSQFAMMETVISGLVDEFPTVLRPRKMILTLFLCIGGFLLGLPQCTRAGIYVVELFSWYSAGFNLMVIALFEIVVVMYIYGFQNFRSDVEMMVGFKPKYYWLATWLVITPAMILFIIIFSSVQHSEVKYQGKEYPQIAIIIGWVMVLVPIIFVPLCGLFEMCKMGVPAVFKPTDDWGPACEQHRTGRYATLTKSGIPSFPMEGKDNPTFEKSEANHM